MPTERLDGKIATIDKAICQNIEQLSPSDRGLLSQNILAQLRNFVELISLKAFGNGKDIECNYSNIEEANKYVRSRGNLRFLRKFHEFLQISASHYTLDWEGSERLMLKYYEYLLRIKSYLKDNHNLDVLENIGKFPLDIDLGLQVYYEKIAWKIDLAKASAANEEDRYYIQKKKPFFVNWKIYYEITFARTNDKSSKFERTIAFTKLDIPQNYATKLKISSDVIEVVGKTMPIYIIENWETSIRPCEIKNFSKLFGRQLNTKSNNQEYKNLMALLTGSGLSLTELISLPEVDFKNVKETLSQEAKTTHFLEILSECRNIVIRNRPAANIIKYLLHKLNNKIIKSQQSPDGCRMLSNLFLKWGCIPFDQMPYDTSLSNHNPKLSDLFDCISPSAREHELLGRLIKNNAEIKRRLFVPKEDIAGFSKIDDLVNLYNSKLYLPKHEQRTLGNYKESLYIKGYVENTVQIIQKMKGLSSTGISYYASSVDSWLSGDPYGMGIDCDEKRNALRQLFASSRVALIYGSAGTGKSTMINHISNFFNDRTKLYLTNTNPANNNLKRKVRAPNCTFKTIASFLSKGNRDTNFDLLFIDECSTVSNSDMLEILNKASFDLLVLVGDVFQIESIRFGNWFDASRSFVPETSIFELKKPYRSSNSGLLKTWEKVRNLDTDILEHIARNGYSIRLDESIFNWSEEDEIVLCLNYDGLYGINNINRLLQENNSNPSIQWGIHIYKVGDPVLFNESVNETGRYGPSIYNNMKGKIAWITTFDNWIQFDVEIDKTLNEFDVSGHSLELVGISDNGKSIIRLSVKKYKSTDEDDDDNSSSDTVVPFQIAYAVSIHKAQGLEYDSVKVVITDEVEEMISHNIFYTAITRTRERLKIYWSPETENRIIERLEIRNITKDLRLLESKYSLS